MKKQVKKLSPERNKILSGNQETDELKLKKLMERVKAFCKVAYQLYVKSNTTDKQTTRTLESEPPNQFTNNAA